MRKNTLMTTVKALKLTFLLDSLLRKHDRFGVQFVTELEESIKLSAAFLVRYPVLPGFEMPAGIWPSRMKHEVFINSAYQRLLHIFNEFNVPSLVESVCLGYKPHPIEHMLKPPAAKQVRCEEGRKNFIARLRGPYQVVGERHWAGMLYFTLPPDAKPAKTTVDARLKSLSRNASWTAVFEDLGLSSLDAQALSDCLLKKYGTAKAEAAAEDLFTSLTTQPGSVLEPEELAAHDELLAQLPQATLPAQQPVPDKLCFAPQPSTPVLRTDLIAVARGSARVTPIDEIAFFSTPKQRGRRAINSLRKGAPVASSVGCVEEPRAVNSANSSEQSDSALALQNSLAQLKEKALDLPEVRGILENIAEVLDGAPNGMSAHLHRSFVANFAPSAACK